MKDSIQVAVVGAVSTTVTLTNVNLILSITVGILSIGFILYKWAHLHKSNKKQQ